MPCRNQQAIRISGGYDGMAMREADAETAVCDYLRQCEVGGFGIEIAFHDLEVGGNGAEVIVGFFVGKVA